MYENPCVRPLWFAAWHFNRFDCALQQTISHFYFYQMFTILPREYATLYQEGLHLKMTTDGVATNPIPTNFLFYCAPPQYDYV